MTVPNPRVLQSLGRLPQEYKVDSCGGVDWHGTCHRLFDSVFLLIVAKDPALGHFLPPGAASGKTIHFFAAGLDGTDWDADFC